MTEPKKYKRGRRTYTRWGSQFKEVRVEGKPKPSADPQPASIPTSPSEVIPSLDIDAMTALGVYSNLTVVYRSSEELVLDFAFVAPGSFKGRVRSRVVISHKQARNLSQLLKQTVDEIQKAEDSDEDI